MIGIWKYITEHGNDGVIIGAYYLLSYSTSLRFLNLFYYDRHGGEFLCW